MYRQPEACLLPSNDLTAAAQRVPDSAARAQRWIDDAGCEQVRVLESLGKAW